MHSERGRVVGELFEYKKEWGGRKVGVVRMFPKKGALGDRNH